MINASSYPVPEPEHNKDNTLRIHEHSKAYWAYAHKVKLKHNHRIIIYGSIGFFIGFFVYYVISILMYKLLLNFPVIPHCFLFTSISFKYLPIAFYFSILSSICGIICAFSIHGVIIRSKRPPVPHIVFSKSKDASLNTTIGIRQSRKCGRQSFQNKRILEDVDHHQDPFLEQEWISLDSKRNLGIKDYSVICSHCKKIKIVGDKNKDIHWIGFEPSVIETFGKKLSHGICPECATTLFPDLTDEVC